MSTKRSIKYVDTKKFELHLYDDCCGPSAITIRINDNETTLELTQAEVKDIKKQLEA